MNRAQCARVLGTHPGASDEELLARLRDEMRLWTQRSNAPTVERRTLAAQRLQELSRVREALGFEPGASAASGGRHGRPTSPSQPRTPLPPPAPPSRGWPPPTNNRPAQPVHTAWPSPQPPSTWNVPPPPKPFQFPPADWRRSGGSPSGSAWVNPAVSPYDFPGIAPAPLTQRVAAVLVDALIWLPVMLIGAALGDLAALLVIAYLGLIAYAEGKIGQSPGKYAVGVRVLGWDDGQPIGVGRSIWRMVCRALGGSFYLLGWIIAIFNPGRRAVHDLFAGTVVVTCPPSARSLNLYLDEVRQAI